ncbi:hypothetical protein vseg_020057 [Gypsophila vaccaria]
MSRLLKQLITRKQSSIKLFSTIPQQSSSFDVNFTPKLNLIRQLIINPRRNEGFGLNNDEKVEKFGGDLGVYPSYSIGYFLNPGMANGSGLDRVIEPVGDVAERSEEMWADSVKKKRKKKMNKHKYKKLRKRLRRKTKKT